ncbi:unnamed protein product [Mytilus coruscus]|uniref:Uncharacterized protein n=1 Tax=Mytilus coruscus TaxID=42192 RepID=A0A6J8BPZ9_MYTCO|nr:unnamed protein product [Mytilus coruscus]
METFKTCCLGELQANDTLQRNGSHGAPSIADSVRSILCPGLPECNNNGTCICNNTFIASDCSIDKRKPPEMFGVRGDGLCDTSEIDCDTAFVLGDHVGSSRDLSCRVHKYHISKSGDKSLTSTWIANASLETFVEVHCPLQDQLHLRSKRNAESEMFMEIYKLSISYDMENFGDELDLIIYDSKCQIADPDSNPPIFALKKSTCYIDGKCYLNDEQSLVDVCNVCNPLSPYAWSIPLEIEGCVKMENKILVGLLDQLLVVLS